MVTVQLSNGTYQYDPKQPLGKRGGFGQAFAGIGPDGARIAVKKLHITAADAAHRELKIAGELFGRNLQHVIPFLDSGEYRGDYFIVMPQADYSLEEWLSKKGQQEAEITAEILLDLISGLVEVGHLIHRDLKPANVLWHEGRWKIADFGIARFVEESTSLQTLNQCLTPEYAAPEQWRFETATHATDVYALGCIAFRLLTGQPPFLTNFSESHQRSPVPAFSCDDARLRTAINMMLTKASAARPSYQRLQALLQTVTSQPIEAIAKPFADLADVGARIAEARQRAQAKFETEKQFTQTRNDLLRNAHSELRANLQRLVDKIAAVVPAADMTGGTVGLKIHLGGALLEVRFGSSTAFEPGIFRESGWDVLGNSTIAVGQEQPEYVWGASLWYVKLKDGSDYRWYEASYWAWNTNRHQPFALGPDRDADYAASNITHSVVLAFGPTPIDGEDEDEFHSRWALLFAMASKRQLRQPSTLPIRSWPPSW
jgi:serine/threonine protein kinase